MKAVIQVVSRAHVKVENQIVGEIGSGLMILLAIHQNDGERQADLMAEKISQLRIFPDPQGKINLSIQDVGGSILVVSQFTLYGNTERGHRPSFSEAALPAQAVPLYEKFVAALKSHGLSVATGHFGALMSVSLVNEGPLTLIIDCD